jgi:hypothetical protein
MEQPAPIHLTFESLVALIQGKKLHVQDGENHFIFLPPTDGVFITHEQLDRIRYQDTMQILEFLHDVGEHKQEYTPEEEG